MLLLIDRWRSAHAGVAKGAQPQTSSPHVLDIVSVAQLAADADNADVDHNDVRLNLDMKQTAGLRCSLRLGGIVLLKSNDDEAIDVAFRYMAGLLVTQTGDEGSMYLPPFLRYGYCSEAPVLFEGVSHPMLPLHSPLHLPPPLAIAHLTQTVRRPPCHLTSQHG